MALQAEGSLLLLLDHPNVGENVSSGCWELLVWNAKLNFCRKETYSHSSHGGLVFPTYPNKKTYWKQ